MADTGNPYGTPQPPYGGQPPQPPYPQAQPPYAQPYGYPQPPGPGPVYDYAHWIKRVAGYLIDGAIYAIASIPAYALVFGGVAKGTENIDTYTDADGITRTTGEWNDAGTSLIVIGSVLFVLPLIAFIWNTCVRQGRTGYSIGKGVLGIKLIGIASGQPIGGGLSFVRYLCHILDSLACYIGWFWPLWDARRQTFADKVMSTVVINQPK